MATVPVHLYVHMHLDPQIFMVKDIERLVFFSKLTDIDRVRLTRETNSERHIYHTRQEV